MDVTLTRAAAEPMRRFRTLAIGATVTYEPAALARRAGAGQLRQESDGGAGAVRYTHRVWWAAPACWRDDVTWPNGQTVVSIVRASAALTYMSALRLMYTSEPVASADGWEVVPPPRGIVYLPTVEQRLAEFPLLRPALPAADWAFTEGPPTEYLGRPCRRVYAARRPGAPAPAAPGKSGYWCGVDEYECLVDDGLQLVVWLNGLADGVPIATFAANDVQVDVSLPAEVFDFRPPSGTRVARIVWRG